MYAKEIAHDTDDAKISALIGASIAKARRSKGITQVELANRLEVTQGIICAYEQGRRRIPITQFIRISQVLEISPGKLLDGSFLTDKSKRKSRRFLRRLEEIEKLPEYEQRALAKTIDAFLVQNKN